ncbi:hypothetical protein KCH_12510 [Kitasatospora cheerisanensis KCTC 2395]|uniref:Uncharacterized protein n=1 Tax=Kitasatospora cheerisanensis KCTC 2395 TaxID=1348663 RepID=A0A066ZA61_9ACTN|nr:hypothetical protein KCH_12510 [Kitasatospora cheerisanensis KCTC 2395]
MRRPLPGLQPRRADGADALPVRTGCAARRLTPPHRPTFLPRSPP